MNLQERLDSLLNRKHEVREYNRRVMPCANQFLSEIVPQIESVFGKVKIDAIRCGGYEWQRGINNNRARKL